MATPIEPIVLIAPNGMLGRAWAGVLARPGLDGVTACTPVSRPEFDVTDADSVVRGIPAGTRTVINCSAYTNVDGAEQDERAAFAINATGVRHLAERCREIGATLVHYSSDYVFDGHAASPIPTDAPRHPMGVYARSKAAGEEAIERSGCRHLLVRTSWLYAPWGKNFVRTMARLTREKPTLKVVNDQRGRPTSCEHLARASLELLRRGADGVFHVTDGGECTWYEFTVEIARQLRHAGCTINPCTTAEYPLPAPRPAYSVLDLTGTEAVLGPMPHWKDNLADVLARLEPVTV